MIVAMTYEPGSTGMPSSRQLGPAKTWHGLALVLVAALLVSLGAPLRDVCAWFGSCPCHEASSGMAPMSDATSACPCCSEEGAAPGGGECGECGETDAPQPHCCCMVLPTSPQEAVSAAAFTPSPYDVLAIAALDFHIYTLAPLGENGRCKPRRAPPRTPQAAGWLPPLRP